MGKLHIDLLNTSFTIQASEDDAYLQKLLGYYTQFINDVSKIDSIKTPLQTSILAGIMLCDELYKTKSTLAALQKGEPLPSCNIKDANELEEHTIAMIEKINKVL